MKKDKVIKAWKDEKFRESLSAEDQALLPDNPAGFVELTDEDLESITGGVPTTGSSPQICSCTVTQTGTGAGCYCSCGDDDEAAKLHKESR